MAHQTTDAIAAYAAELERMRGYLGALSASIEAVRGGGTLSHRINWAHVGDLKHVNSILDQAVQVKFSKVE